VITDVVVNEVLGLSRAEHRRLRAAIRRLSREPACLTMLGKIFTRLRFWQRRHAAKALGDLRFLMYTRRGCHLCDVAWAELEKAQRSLGFVLESEDVDDDPALAARFGDQVPVVTVNGEVRFRGGVNAVLLNRLLEAEAAKGLRKRAT
jgi:glutaredoxin